MLVSLWYDTTLSLAQHARLDKLADERPLARVVGWDNLRGGPIVRDGYWERAVNRHGRIISAAPAGLRAA